MGDPRPTLLHRAGTAAATAGRDPARHPRLWAAGRVAITVVVLVFLAITVATQWHEVREERVAVDAVWIAPALAILIFVHFLAALGWELTVSALGSELRPRRAQSIWAQSLLARYVPGVVLMVIGRVLLAEREGVPRRTTMASLVYEQFLMVVSAVIVGAWAMISEDLLGTPGQIAALAIVPVLLTAMHPRIFGPLANSVLRLFGREPLSVVPPLRAVLALLGFFLVVWIVFGIGVFFAARIVFPLEAGDIPAVTAAQALGYSAALITVVFPGGLGVRDAVFAVTLDQALPGGFALAVAIALVVRLVTTVAEVLYAAWAIFVGRRDGGAGKAAS